MKILIWLLTIGMSCLLIHQVQAQKYPAQNYMVQKLVLTDSIPILKMESLMKQEGFSFTDAAPYYMKLNISSQQDGTYTIESSVTCDAYIFIDKNILGVFEFRDMLFYVQNNIIPDFMQQTKQKRSLGSKNTAISPSNNGKFLLAPVIIDDPAFIFEYKDGEIQLKEVIRY